MRDSSRTRVTGEDVRRPGEELGSNAFGPTVTAITTLAPLDWAGAFNQRLILFGAKFRF